MNCQNFPRYSYAHSLRVTVFSETINFSLSFSIDNDSGIHKKSSVFGPWKWAIKQKILYE